MNSNEKNSLNQVVSTLLVETQERNQKNLWFELVKITNQDLIDALFKNFSKLTIYQIEDIIQETYFKFNKEILKRREKNKTLFLDEKGEKIGNFFSYLYIMAKNEALSVSKKATKMQPLTENYDAIEQKEILFDEENQLVKIEYRSKYLAISAIDPESQREAFYTIIQFELQAETYTNDDVAKIINAPSANAVTQRKKEAKKKYIQLLKNYGKRTKQTENIDSKRIENKIKQKLVQNSILEIKSENTKELELLIWQIILLTKEDNFENYCKFFLLDSVSETKNKENKIDFSELNYIFSHWIENLITYELLINPKLK